MMQTIKKNTFEAGFWARMNQFLPLSNDPKYDDLYKPIDTAWGPFFQNEYPSRIPACALRADRTYRSRLSEDLASIANMAQERRDAGIRHPLHELAQEAVAAMQQRGKPNADWARRIGEEMTDAAD